MIILVKSDGFTLSHEVFDTYETAFDKRKIIKA